MRRLRETGIVTILLLGLTGCAGVQQRMGWTEPPYLGAENTDERPLSRLAFWRRHRADDAAGAAAASELPQPGRTPMIAGNGTTTDADEERPGLLRRLPLVGRLFNGGDRDEMYEPGAPAVRYTNGALNSRSVALIQPRTPAAPAARTPSANGTAAASSIADAQPPAMNPEASPSPTTAAVDGSEDPPLRELTADLDGERPQVDSAAVPVRNADAAPQLTSTPNSQPQPRNPAEPPPVPSLGREDAPPPVAQPGAQPSTAAPDLSPAPSSRGPSPPSPSDASPPDSASPPAVGSLAPTLISTPGPIWPATGQTIFSGSSQSVVMTSPQGEYVSGGCDAPCGPKCKIHKLCPFKKHKQMIASSVVMPSAQAAISSCDSPAPCKVKKPCFLKTWLHHKSSCKTKGCGGCKTCSYCGEAPTMVSAQGPIVSPQGW